jgi:hypothetical protein
LNFLKTPFKVTMNGDAIGSVRVDGKPNTYGLPSVKDFLAKFKSTNDKSTSSVTVTLVDIGARSIYDLCSNGTPAQIWQDPNTPANIHAVFVCSPPGDPTFAVRLSKYYLSTDFGVTWSFIADVPTARAGFPTISGFSDGSALIANHNVDAGTQQRSQAYKDAAPGLGSFTRLEPPTVTSAYVWPRVVATTNLTIANKFLLIGSQNPADTTAIATCTNVNATPGTWVGWNKIVNADQAETYSLARGTDGRIGLLYKNHDVAFDNDYGCVFFIESTDNGTTFTPALKIFQSNFTGTGDSLGSLRGLNLVYQGNIPKAVFETITLSKTTVGSYYPGLNANIKFWSTSLSGTDPNRSIVLADTNTVGYHPYFGVADVMAPLCRPSIGVSSDGSKLFCAFQVPSDIAGGTGADTTPFMNLYLSGSTNNGNTWFAPAKLNPTTPIKDWRWVSVSKWNDMVGTNYYCNMVCNRDSVPGSFVNGTGNGESNSQYWSMRALVTFPVGINNISSEVPANYSLSQNYPNPFNPTTNINFALIKTGFVSLKVYDLAGKEVSSLVNEKLSTGTYSYSLNASNLSSGIYFYTLRTDGFTATKKMMLIK